MQLVIYYSIYQGVTFLHCTLLHFGVAKYKQELAERIYKYFDEVNREPVVYHWKYKMDEISMDEAASV